MPDTLGEPFTYPLLHSRSSVEHPTLPIHVAQHRQIQHQRRQSQAEQGTELRNIASQERDQLDTDTVLEHSTKHPIPSETEESEDSSLLCDDEAENSQMQRKSRKAISKPDLKIKVDQNGYVNGDANGHANGDTNGSMNSHLEMRRKHASLEDSESIKEHTMSREDFSLDHEPPPQTPQTPGMENTSFANLPPQDKRNFLMLVLLYFLQGIPMGLASGSVPFLLKPHLSYGQIGIFSLVMYPYSLKLLWSPIVDAVWSPRLGRRKSWILPIQTISGLSMVYLGSHINDMMENAGTHGDSGVWNFTGWWFMLVFLCATQDIAVDGWAISLLSVQNLSYASTAQSVGLTAGSFLSHTVFLALQAPEFANKWFRKAGEQSDIGLITLGGYITFFGWVYLLVTFGLAVLKKENKTRENEGIVEVYRSMWSVLKLKPIHSIIIIHLVAKLGFITNEAVTNLKLIDKGFGQANLALVVLIDFPFELSLGYYAGKWSTEYGPLKLWCWAFVARLGAAVWAQITIQIYPSGYPESVVPLWYMLIVIAEHIYTTFMGTIMFVALSAFHARIADPAIGGTYMTLLATVSNLGGTFPKIIILKFVDLFTKATCIPPADISGFPADKQPITAPFSCSLEVDKHRCTAGGGLCQIQRDGFYVTNVVFVIIGAILFWGYIQRTALRLEALPVRSWRIHGSQGYNRVGSGGGGGS